MPDFHPPASSSSRASGSAASYASGPSPGNSLSQKHSANSLTGSVNSQEAPSQIFEGSNTFRAEEVISPLSEVNESVFHLDMNLDDMEGIVDTSLANTQPTAIPSRPTGMSIQSDVSSTSTTAQSTGSAMLLQDALDQTSSLATTVSTGSAGSAGSESPTGSNTPGRAVVSAARRTSSSPFARPNPFQPGSSDGSINSIKPTTPPSPYTRSLSPKHFLPPNTQPRRPSQLRNVKMSSIASDGSSEPDSGPLQPLAPAWATMTPASQTVFNDPFGAASVFQPATGEGVSPSRPPTRSARSPPEIQTDSTIPSALQVPMSGIPPTSAAAVAAMWAAPESWGVEGDEDEDNGDVSTSDEEAGAWADYLDEDSVSPTNEKSPHRNGSLSVPRPGIDDGKGKTPPPFGFRSSEGGEGKRPSGTRPSTAGQSKFRGRGGSARPSTATRGAVSGRPGTGGSMTVSATQVSCILVM
jgi:adenylate cyclase